MKCLWLTRKFPRPSNSGELIYSDGLIRSLSATGVSLTVIAHDNDESPVGSGSYSQFWDEQGIEWRLGNPELGDRWPSLFTRYPSDAWRLKNGGPETALIKALREESWDVILIDHAAIGWAAFPIDNHCSKGVDRPLIVYISHNHEAKVRREIARNCSDPFPKSAALRYDAWKYARLEENLCRSCDLVTAIPETEVEAYRANFPKQEFLCLTPGYDGSRKEGRVISDSTPRRVIMSGSFEWIAKRINLELFLGESASFFEREGIEIQVVGKAEESFRQAMMKKFPGVSIVGKVPEMTPYLNEARMGLIVEEHGGGFKLKSLEYIFHGLPIAGLEKAVDGLPLRSPDHLVLSPDTSSLVREVAAAIDDIERLNDMSTQSMAICERSFRWEDRGQDLLRKIESLRSVALAR